MGVEKQSSDQADHKASAEVDKKIHKTHFPVSKTRLRDNGYDSGYEWVNSGTGRLKLVRKKTQKRP